MVEAGPANGPALRPFKEGLYNDVRCIHLPLFKFDFIAFAKRMMSAGAWPLVWQNDKGL